jgi:hypothetical protein
MPKGVRRVSLWLAIASFSVIQLLAAEATARVRTPDYNHLGRKMDAGDLEHPGAKQQGAAKPRQICDISFGTTHLSAAGMHGAPSLQLSEVRFDSMPDGAAYREVLSFLDDVHATSDFVQVVEATTADGAKCPLSVSVVSGSGTQTFWKFAPDDEPAGWFDERGRRLGDPALAQPKPGSRMSSPFGPRRYYGRLSGGGFHDGIDFESRVGEPVFAAADGIIDHQGWYFEYGLTIKIRHATQFTTLYAHLSRFGGGLGVGARVSKGDLIGYVGTTGRSTGAHLHFSTIANGQFVNPTRYLAKNGNRTLSVQALFAFRKWQQDMRAALESIRDRQRRPHFEEVDWTTRT